jgi:hypothetical protein
MEVLKQAKYLAITCNEVRMIPYLGSRFGTLVPNVFFLKIAFGKCHFCKYFQIIFYFQCKFFLEKNDFPKILASIFKIILCWTCYLRTVYHVLKFCII